LSKDVDECVPLLDGGFERALIAGYARQPPGDGIRYGNDFSYALQPSCCAVDEGHCKVRVPGGQTEAVAQMSAEAKEVWPGNKPGRDTSTIGQYRYIASRAER